MKYRQLKNTGICVSWRTVGTWGMSGTGNFGYFDRQDSIAAIRAAIEGGVNHIDTAPVYGNGYAEQLVGEAIAGLDRSRLLISTKFGLSPHALTRAKRDAGFDAAMREVESSLRNLKTDYIDFYFVHWPDESTPIAETMTALNLLKSMGKIRHIGLSNFSQKQIEEARQYGQIDVLQTEYSMVNRKNEAVIRWCEQQGIDVFTYGSLGSGILSGKYRSIPEMDPSDTRINFYDYFKEPKFSRIQRLLKVMDQIADRHHCPLAQVAMNWSLSQPGVSTALIGVLKKSQAVENCQAFQWQLDAEEIALLNQTIIKENL